MDSNVKYLTHCPRNGSGKLRGLSGSHYISTVVGGGVCCRLMMIVGEKACVDVTNVVRYFAMSRR